MSNLAVNAITDASGGSAASINGYTPSASNMTGRNRIINGAMMIDQRNAGASVTANDGYVTVDRWKFNATQNGKGTIQQVSTAPAGFSNSLLFTSTSAYSVGTSDWLEIQQRIEGLNVADLGWGTSDAKTVTLSFWVRSSLTGTFGGSFYNSAFNRSYPFTYTISSADTWEQKTVTVAGDTSGTWLTTNGIGIRLGFSLGAGSTYSGTAGAWAGSGLTSATGATSVVGTSGATFYITGVQLEVGSSASEFEHRQYGQELALCQRYYAKSYSQETVPGTATALGMLMTYSGGGGTGNDLCTGQLPVTMRSTPTLTFYDSLGASGKLDRIISNSASTGQTASAYVVGDRNFGVYGASGVANANGLRVHYTAAAEL